MLKALDIGLTVMAVVVVAAVIFYAVLPAPVEQVEDALRPSVAVKLAERGWSLKELQLWETEEGYEGTLKLKGGVFNRTVTRKITVWEEGKWVKWKTSPLGL